MPAGTRRGSCFLISLDFAYKPQCLLIVTGAAIGPVEADGEHVGRQLMAHRGGVLEQVEGRPERGADINENLAQPGKVARVRVADRLASQVVEEGIAE